MKNNHNPQPPTINRVPPHDLAAEQAGMIGKVDVIYNKSCQRMDELPDECIDVVLTDPPWNVGKDYGVYKDNLPWPEYWEFMDNCFREITRVMKPGYLLFTYWGKTMWELKPIVEGHGWQYIQMLIWFHPNGYGGQNQHFWNHRFEPILVFKKSSAPRLLKGTWFTNVITEATRQSNYKKETRVHPAQKPIALYEKILSKLPGEIILDPFAGSGAVLKAAKRQNRHCIGYEINPEYCEKLIKLGLNDIDPLFRSKNETN